MSYLIERVEYLRKRYPSKTWEQLAEMLREDCKRYERYLDKCESARRSAPAPSPEVTK